MTTEAYLAEHARLTTELDALVDARPAASMSDGDRIVCFLRDLKLAWEMGGEAERGNLVASATTATSPTRAPWRSSSRGTPCDTDSHSRYRSG